MRRVLFAIGLYSVAATAATGPRPERPPPRCSLISGFCFGIGSTSEIVFRGLRDFLGAPEALKALDGRLQQFTGLVVPRLLARMFAHTTELEDGAHGRRRR